jgi:rare lipoprotein A (peptidoglycan hydrolase)
VRHRYVVAGVALIALLATVAVPGPVGSRVPSPETSLDPGLFQRIEIATPTRGTEMTISPQDPGARSNGALNRTTALVDPAARAVPRQAPVRPTLRTAAVHTLKKVVPVARPSQQAASTGTSGTSKSSSTGGWHHDGNVSWYGPGFYGNHTACGQVLTRTIVGVAHKTLPCGTLVTFRYKGVTVTAPVIDRGPYVAGRQWDLAHGLCVKLNHCFTGTIDWRLGR